jgi:hypothetical protein
MPATASLTAKRLAIAGGAALLLAAAAVGGWYAASPWSTLRQMHGAAQAGDVPRFAAFVDSATIDAEELRNARSSARGMVELLRPDNEAGRSMRERALRSLAVPDSEIRVPPEEMMPWFAEMRLRFPGLDARGDPENPRIHRIGWHRFEVHYGDNDYERSPFLGFHREGLGWRLDAIRWGQQ